MKKTFATLTIGLSISATVGLAVEKPAGASLRPWPAQYKIKPNETGWLTPADVVGPDGIVYPNWTRCGVQGGIPDVKPFATVEKYGGRADDDGDDAEALERACETAGQRGGGAVMLGEGTYYLDRPVTVRHDGEKETRLSHWERARVPAPPQPCHPSTNGSRPKPRRQGTSLTVIPSPPIHAVRSITHEDPFAQFQDPVRVSRMERTTASQSSVRSAGGNPSDTFAPPRTRRAEPSSNPTPVRGLNH